METELPWILAGTIMLLCICLGGVFRLYRQVLDMALGSDIDRARLTALEQQIVVLRRDIENKASIIHAPVLVPIPVRRG